MYATDKDRAKEREGSCNKEYNTHQKLTPGLFLGFCPHMVCVSIKVLNTCEGPSTFVDIIFTRLDEGDDLLVGFPLQCVARCPGATLSDIVCALQRPQCCCMIMHARPSNMPSTERQGGGVRRGSASTVFTSRTTTALDTIGIQGLGGNEHAGAHKASCNRCTSGFNLERYNGDIKVAPGVMLSDLNTQVCEQTNSVLQRI